MGSVIPSVIGSVASGLLGARGAGKAASQQAAGYQTAERYLQPYSQFGQQQMNPLLSAINSRAMTTPFKFDGSKLAQTPGYQFTLNQGLKAATNSAAARGLGMSGAQMRGASQFASGLAQQTYGDEFNRQLGAWGANLGQQQQRVGNLANLVGMGAQTASAMGQNAIGAGEARAGGTVGRTNALTGAIGDVSMPYYMDWLQNPQRGQGRTVQGLPWLNQR